MITVLGTHPGMVLTFNTVRNTQYIRVKIANLSGFYSGVR